MIDILTRAGYSPASAGGRMSSSHPLFTRTGPDRYRLIGQLSNARGQGPGKKGRTTAATTSRPPHRPP